MQTLCVLQHVESDYLGLIENHLEARNIRFRYCRPFVPGGRVPTEPGDDAGLIILGAGPLGIVSGPLVPSLAPELRLIAEFLARGLPVIGLGLGAAMLAVAAGGGAQEAPLRCEVGTARRVASGALAGNLPEVLPYALYMRDRAVPPPNARILATNDSNEPVVFQVADIAFGFLGHPGIKSAMVEDLVMEISDSPDDIAESLSKLRAVQGDIAEALTSVMVGLVKHTGWMTAGR
ncbi:MAG: hypothetical protein ACTSU0_09680 [Alphaproteobacteria bacterium]